QRPIAPKPKVPLLPTADGEKNMALDVELLARAEQGHLVHRVYGWDGPWASLGRFQKPEDVLVDPAFPHVVRPTGGKAVLHGHDVTVALAVPLTHLPGEVRSVKVAYRALTAPLIRALRLCGLPAVLVEGSRHVAQDGRAFDCFVSRSVNDIVDERTGDKVCGCALRLTSKAALLQASLPVRAPLVNPTEVFRGATYSGWSIWGHEAFAEVFKTQVQGWKNE
ncbi:MAG: lipoyl protein ligase domain-containing protein, partial [Fimbriimonas sp.]